MSTLMLKVQSELRCRRECRGNEKEFALILEHFSTKKQIFFPKVNERSNLTSSHSRLVHLSFLIFICIKEVKNDL